MHARLLAFDTSTEVLSVALHDGLALYARSEAGGPLASTRIVPAIGELLAQASMGYRDLDAIGFGCGPGAFTGVRTSCAVAQGLALGLTRPVLAIDSLLIVAEDARLQLAVDGPVEIAVAMDARMAQVYAGRYRHDGRRWQQLEAPALLDVAQLLQAWHAARPDAFAGSAWLGFADALAALQGPRITREAGRAASLMHLAQQAWQQGAAIPAAGARPVYLRDKVALTTAERVAEREASRAAKGAGA